MKKIIALILTAAISALLLCGCVGTCDLCGKSGSVTEYELFGETIKVCDDCL